MCNNTEKKLCRENVETIQSIIFKMSPFVCLRNALKRSYFNVKFYKQKYIQSVHLETCINDGEQINNIFKEVHFGCILESQKVWTFSF